MINSKIKFFYKQNKFILNNSFSSIFLSGLGIFLLLIQNIIISRVFDDVIFGQYSFIISLFILLSVFSKFGIENFSYKNIPNLKEQPDLLKGLYLFAIIRTLFFSILILLGVYLISFFLNSFNPLLDAGIYIIGFWFILRSLSEIFSFFFQAIKKTISSRCIFSVLPPAISIILIYINLTFNYYAPSITLIFLIILSSYFISLLIILSIDSPFNQIKNYKASFKIKIWMKSSFNFMLLSGFFLILSRINPLIVSFFFNIEYVGYYSAALNISTLISFGLHATNRILAPTLSQNYNDSNMTLFQKNLTICSRIGFIMSLFLIIPLILFSEQILSLYGKNFTQFGYVLVILSIGQLINSFLGPVGISMTMTGKENIVAYSVLIALFSNLFFAYILIPDLGILGLALSNVFGIVIWKVLLVIYVKFKFNYRTTILG